MTHNEMTRLLCETSKLVDMNILEQSLKAYPENLISNGTSHSLESHGTSARRTASAARKQNRPEAVLIFLVSLGAVAALVYLLRTVPPDLLHQEFEGLGAVVCALAYGGVILRRVARALAQDTRQAGGTNQSQGVSRQDLASNAKAVKKSEESRT